MYHHVLHFAREMTAETASLIVPSHVENFVKGRVYPPTPDGKFLYAFDTSEEMSTTAVKDIVKLTHATSMNPANLAY